MTKKIDLQNQTMETGLFLKTTNLTPSKKFLNGQQHKKRIDILPGDVLIKVNEESVNHAINRNAYFTVPSRDKELQLSFNRHGQTIVNMLHPQASLFDSNYDEWIDQNQKRVDEKSNQRIAYGYMKKEISSRWLIASIQFCSQ
ncbi:MAG: hypothetical protein IPP42_05275 [Saprospiraceae bacterium]|nr:hypothetical protein [Saprospiraceae bacterium]